MNNDGISVTDSTGVAQRKRAAIKVANEIPLNVSQVIITGGGAGLICTETLQKTLSSRSDEPIKVIGK